MTLSLVDIETFSDADFVRAFNWRVGADLFDFTDHSLAMMVRAHADDAEVWVSLTSSITGWEGGIYIGPPDVDEKLTTFSVKITREQLERMPPGSYVHSLILIRPDGERDDIWRGTLTHEIGPTR